MRLGEASRVAAGDRDGQSAGLRHLAVIMDGNGRWAKARRLPRIAGHRAGVEAVRRVVEAAPGLGIEVLTLYAFSSENWKRPADEVADLMGLLLLYLRSEIKALHRNNVRVDYIGDYKVLKPDIVKLLEDLRVLTAGNSGLHLIIALNYGGQDELLRAARRIAAEAAAGRLSPEAITAETIDSLLDTAGLPPPDMVLRTSGEMRLSNFLLWQSAYAEFISTETLWPDFNAATLGDAIAEFATRERRFGGR